MLGTCRYCWYFEKNVIIGAPTPYSGLEQGATKHTLQTSTMEVFFARIQTEATARLAFDYEEVATTGSGRGAVGIVTHIE